MYGVDKSRTMTTASSNRMLQLPRLYVFYFYLFFTSIIKHGVQKKNHNNLINQRGETTLFNKST